MADNKKYYWLKLKDDFFEEKQIKYLRSLPDGDKLVITYLKMQLKSLKTEGLIKYDQILPSNEEELAMILDEDVNIIKLTLSALIKVNAIEILEDGSFYMLAMQQLIGKEGTSAERVRQFRKRKKEAETKMLQCNTDVTKCNTEIEIEKEIEKEIDINIDKNKKKKKETEFDVLINNNFSDEELKNTVYEFIKMRKAIKKPLTTKGLELMIKKLYDLSNNIDEQIQILNNSIMNNWQGIFALKKEKNKSKGKFDDFKEIWEEAKIQDEQTRNGTSNNFASW